MRRFMFRAMLGFAILLWLMSLVGWWYLSSDSAQEPELAGSLQPGQLVHDKLPRRWLAWVPATLSEPAPVVIVLHGSLGSAEQIMQATYYDFNALAERDGFIAVYPNGVDKHWNDCRASADYAANKYDIDDVGFLAAMLDSLAADYAIDRDRVYVAGLSNGGHMAYRLALEAPELIAGVAAIAASLPVAENLGCDSANIAMPTLIINGTADFVNPYEGGLVTVLGNASRGEVRSSMATARYWASLAGHGDDGELHHWPQREAGAETSVTSTHWHAPGREPVLLVTVENGGHTIPHPTYRQPRLLGTTSNEFDAVELIWSFFANGRVDIPGVADGPSAGN